MADTLHPPQTSGETEKLSPVEEVKRKSNYLRGEIAQELTPRNC
jgi:hypothetical protein